MAEPDPTFPEVNNAFPNLPELEHRWLERWAQARTFQRLREQNAEGEPWSFLDGPITANNPMGVHHAWGRSLKDMFQRFYAMQGRAQRYQNGFDCQGLWVEVEVEKAFGLESKQEIAELGLDRFVRECKARVLEFAAIQTAQSIRLGYWMDWDEPNTLLDLREALLEQRDEVTITTPSGKAVSGSPEELIGRLGSPEFGGSYFTFATENNYTIWGFLKKCHDEGFVYRGADVVPWCSRCGTGISNQEVKEGQKIVEHTSVFVRFPLRGRDKEALVAWTTTPWTLTSNVAAAVNPAMTYLKVKHGEWTYYLGQGNYRKDRTRELEAEGKKKKFKLQTLETILKGTLPKGEKPEILGEVPGSELVGLVYDGPFDHLPAAQRPGGLHGLKIELGPGDKSAQELHRVVAWEEVSEAEGTGVVHIAPGCGAEDFRLGQSEGLIGVAPLDDQGHYLEGFDWLSGRKAARSKDGTGGVAADVVKDLRERGLLVAKESYPHVYPHCWRCKEELVFRLVEEWFIRMDWRDRIQSVVPDVRWIPPDGEAREQDWLMNMGDWMISKKRFWGLALPIWTCGSCGVFDVIGSEAELQQRATTGWEEFEGHTPHRPFVDQVELKCPSPDCSEPMRRVEDVGNPWLDAGIVPFSTVRYNSDRDYWEKWFPADLVLECFPGQFRNWFYSLLAMSSMLERQAPFKTLLGHALVRDGLGREMHKSAGNSIPFDQAADVFGADLMRYIYASQPPVQDLNFPPLPEQRQEFEKNPNFRDREKEVRSNLNTLWQCYSLFVTYARADGWSASGEPLPVAERGELDRWILSRFDRLVETAQQAFPDFVPYKLMRQLETFLDELSNWYVRRSRRRFWKSESDQDKQAAYWTLYEVLVGLSQVLAPVVPFLADELYQTLVVSQDPQAPDSVHLTRYPQPDPARRDEALERQIDCVIRTKNLGLSVRSQHTLRVRQPLARILVRPRDDHDQAVLADPHFRDQVLEEVNAKALELVEDERQYVTVTAKANFKALGPRYGKSMKAIAAHVAQVDAAALQAALETEAGYRFQANGTEIVLGKGDVQLNFQSSDDLAVAVEAGTFVALDTTLTPELIAEGIARDFNRAAQDQRKVLDLDVSDRITVRFQASERVTEAVLAHVDYLKGELLADSLEPGDVGASPAQGKAGGEDVSLVVEKA